MTVNVRIYKGQKPTEEQRMEIREAAKREPLYDEEAPELSVEQMQRYKKAARERKNEITGNGYLFDNVKQRRL